MLQTTETHRPRVRWRARECEREGRQEAEGGRGRRRRRRRRITQLQFNNVNDSPPFPFPAGAIRVASSSFGVSAANNGRAFGASLPPSSCGRTRLRSPPAAVVAASGGRRRAGGRAGGRAVGELVQLACPLSLFSPRLSSFHPRRSEASVVFEAFELRPLLVTALSSRVTTRIESGDRCVRRYRILGVVSLAIHYFLCRSPLCPKCLNDLTTVKERAGLPRPGRDCASCVVAGGGAKGESGEEKPREE